MATQIPDRPITRWMAYTKVPVSSGNLEPSGRKKKRTVSSTTSTMNSTAPRTRDHMKDDDLELDSGEVDVA